jgi:hypothetical protein
LQRNRAIDFDKRLFEISKQAKRFTAICGVRRFVRLQFPSATRALERIGCMNTRRVRVTPRDRFACATKFDGREIVVRDPSFGIALRGIEPEC